MIYQLKFQFIAFEQFKMLQYFEGIICVSEKCLETIQLTGLYQFSVYTTFVVRILEVKGHGKRSGLDK